MSDIIVREQAGALKITAPEVVNKVLLEGDLSVLTPKEKELYHNAMCESLGLNPVSKPFDYLTFKGKLVLYPNKSCAEQLRKAHKISVGIPTITDTGESFRVAGTARDSQGREDYEIAVLFYLKENGTWEIGRNDKKYFKGDGTYSPPPPPDKAVLEMKALTKWKRRITFSLCGLTWANAVEDQVEQGSGDNWEEVEEVRSFREELKVLKASLPFSWEQIKAACDGSSDMTLTEFAGAARSLVEQWVRGRAHSFDEDRLGIWLHDFSKEIMAGENWEASLANFIKVVTLECAIDLAPVEGEPPATQHHGVSID